MKTFAELIDQDLTWVQTKSALVAPNIYELKNATGETFATLTRSQWTGAATVDAPGNRWTFERKVGFFKPSRILITSQGTGEQPAEYVFKGMSGGGTLTYPDGRTFEWKQVNVWSSKYMWTLDTGEGVLGIETKGVFKTRGEVRIDPELTSEKAPPMLLFLGWYLILVAQDDATAGALIATTAATSAT